MTRRAKDFKARILLLNRHLKKASELYKFPLHKLRVQRGHEYMVEYDHGVKLGNLINVETGEIVENDFDVATFDEHAAVMRLISIQRESELNRELTPADVTAIETFVRAAQEKYANELADIRAFNQWNGVRAAEAKALGREHAWQIFMQNRNRNGGYSRNKSQSVMSKRSDYKPVWKQRSDAASADPRWNQPAPVRVLMKDGKTVDEMKDGKHGGV